MSKKVKKEVEVESQASTEAQNEVVERMKEAAAKIDPILKEYGFALGAKMMYGEGAITAQVVLVDQRANPQQ